MAGSWVEAELSALAVLVCERLTTLFPPAPPAAARLRAHAPPAPAVARFITARRRLAQLPLLTMHKGRDVTGFLHLEAYSCTCEPRLLQQRGSVRPPLFLPSLSDLPEMAEPGQRPQEPGARR